jgi:cell division protein FtsI (penicillin-binding protein 3)
VNYAANPLLKINARPWRWRLLLLALLAWFVLLFARAVYLQGLNTDFLQREGRARMSRVLEISAHRGMIADRRGAPLAISTPVESLWADPTDVGASPGQLKELAGLLGMGEKELHEKLARHDRDFAYIRRHLPPEQAEAVMRMGLSGFYLKREHRRYYPAGEVTAHILGFTGVDDNGLEGLEYAFQDWLGGVPGSRRVLKDRLGHVVENVESIRAPQQGRDLALTLDLDIQYLAYRELAQAVNRHKARSGSVVVLDGRNGEILALANYPSFNPNNRSDYRTGRTRNRAVADVFEPGSTLKPFTVASALDQGKVGPNTMIDTGPGYMVLGPARIRDVHPKGRLTVTEAIQVSSNVATAKIALSLPAAKLWASLDRAGFGRYPNTGAPGEALGRLRPYTAWRPIEQATISYGHGISVSLLQLAQAYTVFANDGRLLRASLIRGIRKQPPVQVFAPRTAQAVLAMMEKVVAPGGTAPKAQVPGYRIAGKTGTAHKLIGGSYASDKYVSSFIGLGPVGDPRLVLAVMIDEPTAGQYYGGSVAAPVFSRIMAGALAKLGIAPDAPLPSQEPLEAAPVVAEGV